MKLLFGRTGGGLPPSPPPPIPLPVPSSDPGDMSPNGRYIAVVSAVRAVPVVSVVFSGLPPDRIVELVDVMLKWEFFTIVSVFTPSAAKTVIRMVKATREIGR